MISLLTIGIALGVAAAVGSLISCFVSIWIREGFWSIPLWLVPLVLVGSGCGILWILLTVILPLIGVL